MAIRFMAKLIWERVTVAMRSPWEIYDCKKDGRQQATMSQPMPQLVSDIGNKTREVSVTETRSIAS